MRELNHNVECEILENINDSLNYEKDNYNQVIITEFISKNSLVEINNCCRKLNKGLSYTCAFGLCGFLFNDFGKEHIINNSYEKDDK